MSDGCPATRWDGGYRFRCGLGAESGTCSMHGPFADDPVESLFPGLRSLPIYSLPTVDGGAPQLALSGGVPVTALLDRIDAGDSVEKVAQDFACDPGSLELLVELREVLR